MPFSLSRCVALQTPRPAEALEFYRTQLDMRFVGDQRGTELAAGGLRFFIDPGNPRLMFELETSDLSVARREIGALGLELIEWGGPDRANLVVDPFGLMWNVFEAPPRTLEPLDEDALVMLKLGLNTHRRADAAEYYARLLDVPVTFSGPAAILDSGPVRLRIEPGLPEGPVLWVRPGTDMTRLGGAIHATAVTDPFGVRWRVSPGAKSDLAAVTELP
jgi:catechol 2,3-dioxygenase-like lactoylglutathione lyase family enzyme